MKKTKRRDIPPLPNELDQMWWIGGPGVSVWVWDHRVGWIEAQSQPWSSMEICVVVPQQKKGKHPASGLQWGKQSRVSQIIRDAIAAREKKYNILIAQAEKRLVDAKNRTIKSKDRSAKR